MKKLIAMITVTAMLLSSPVVATDTGMEHMEFSLYFHKAPVVFIDFVNYPYHTETVDRVRFELTDSIDSTQSLSEYVSIAFQIRFESTLALVCTTVNDMTNYTDIILNPDATTNPSAFMLARTDNPDVGYNYQVSNVENGEVIGNPIISISESERDVKLPFNKRSAVIHDTSDHYHAPLNENAAYTDIVYQDLQFRLDPPLDTDGNPGRFIDGTYIGYAHLVLIINE